MIKRILAVDGVMAIVHFRDDGEFIDGYGMINTEMMHRLAAFAHDYKRLTQSNADQLSMFTQVSGWTPPRGWIVSGKDQSVCSIGNLVCLVENKDGNFSDVMMELTDIANYV